MLHTHSSSYFSMMHIQVGNTLCLYLNFFFFIIYILFVLEYCKINGEARKNIEGGSGKIYSNI